MTAGADTHPRVRPVHVVAPSVRGMSENAGEHDRDNGADDRADDGAAPTHAIPDEQLPPDLVAGEDNPLAEGLPDGEGGDLLEGGKIAEEMDEPDAEQASGPAQEHD